MAPETIDNSLLQQWIGKTETVAARIHASTVNALAATLDLESHFDADAPLPPLWHWASFWHAAPHSELGPDGHPKRGGLLPPVPLPRRMWAGGRLSFMAALPVEGLAVRRSEVTAVTPRRGTSGDLVFVTVRHALSHQGVLCVEEEHDIVYRGLPAPGAAAAAPKRAPEGAAWSRTITPDPVLLFRYSALTFNGHRIHYDRSYATQIEAYPGLVVHGPLIATLLATLLAQHMPQARLEAFSFRAVGPLFDIEPFAVCGSPDPDGRTVRLWAQNLRGELAMQALATLAA